MPKRRANRVDEPTPAPPPMAAPVDDWPARFRSNPDGLRLWNGLKAGERKAVDLSGADLGGLELAAIALHEIVARRASFVGANLSGAEMSAGCFDSADFSTANLQAARLVGAQAMRAAFRGARLAKADLRRGMFFGSSFAGADLTRANLADTNLHTVDFRGANLDGVTLEGASFDGRTEWPPGFVIPPNVLYAGKGTDPRLSGTGRDAVALDAIGLIARLNSVIDPKRRKRAFEMIKKGKNQVFAEVRPALVRGIVRSQREEGLIYSCVLAEGGVYACYAPDLTPCRGLRGEPCKHLVVLLIGLARAGKLDVATVDRWIIATAGRKHQWDDITRNYACDNLLQYKAMQAGEVDWRPTETLPEDFYSI